MKTSAIILGTLSCLAGATLAANSSNSSGNSSDPFKKYTISAEGINATFIPYGARLTNLFVFDKNNKSRDVVLGYDNPHAYLNDSETVHTFFGAVVGRYANRIKNGTFTIDGETYKVPTNENDGKDTLHGGTTGYDQRNWTVSAQTKSSITFSLYDDGLEDFPGAVMNHVTYSLAEGPTWTIRMVSVPLTKATPIMLSSHAYWNLDAFSDPEDPLVLNQTLQMPYSDRYILTDSLLVPNGSLAMVDGTVNDFLEPKKIGKDIHKAKGNCGGGCTGYDTAFIIDRSPSSGTMSSDQDVLTLKSAYTGIRLDVSTNQQALQIYSCNGLDGTIPVKETQQSSSNDTYVEKYGCLVIETEQWIDGINQPEWGQNDYQVFDVDTEPAVVFSTYRFSTFDD